MPVKSFFEADGLLKDVSIPEVNLDTSFREQAALFATYAGYHFQAMRQLSRFKMMLELTEAKVSKDIRAAVADEKDAAGKPVKLTVDEVKARVATTPAVITAQKDKDEAEAQFELVKLALEAFKQRKDMLVGLGATAREEMKSEIGIRGATGMSPALMDQLKTMMTNGGIA